MTGCPAPRSRWWFTGAGAGLDHSSSLLLANVDPGPAVLDVTVLGPDGPVETVATDGITLAPHTVRRIDLADIAPQTDDLAVEVQTSARPGGRVGDRLLRARGHGAAPARSGWPARTSRAGPSASPACPQRPRRARSWSRTRPTWRPRSTCGSPARRARSRPPVSTRSPSRREPSRRSTSAGCSRRREPVALRLRSRVPVVATVRFTDGRRPRLRDAGAAARRAGRRARRTRDRVQRPADRRRRRHPGHRGRVRREGRAGRRGHPGHRRDGDRGLVTEGEGCGLRGGHPVDGPGRRHRARRGELRGRRARDGAAHARCRSGVERPAVRPALH